MTFLLIGLFNLLDLMVIGISMQSVDRNIKPTQQFKNDFNLVLNHYQVDVNEAKYEKARVMANYDDAALCYATIADEIKRGLV